MKKSKFLAVLLALAMLLTLLPTAALAEEPAENGLETEQAAPVDETETAVPPETPEEPAGQDDGAVPDAPAAEAEPVEPTDAELLQARIDALPAADAVAELMESAPEQVDAIYEEVRALTEAVEALDGELDTARLDALVELFTPDVGTLAAMDNCPGGNACTHAAAIGSTHYDTLQVAFEEAKSKDTVTLLRNVTGDVTAHFEKTKYIYLELDGHTLDGNITCSNRVYLYINYYDSSEQASVIMGNVTAAGSGVTIYIYGGHVAGNVTASQEGTYGTITLYGGYFAGTVEKGGKGTLSCLGGYYVNDPSAYVNFADNYLVNNVEAGEQASAFGCKYRVDEEKNAEIIQTDGTRVVYRNLKTALSKSNDGDTVVLIHDADIKNSKLTIGKSIVLDLNGHEVVGNHDWVFECNKYSGDRITVTIKNGSITRKIADGQTVTAGKAIYTRQKVDLILENVKVTANDTGSYGIQIGEPVNKEGYGGDGLNPTVTIRGVESAVTGESVGISIFNKNSENPDGPTSGTLTVEDGIITGGWYGIAGNGTNHNTSITINGGTVKSTNAEGTGIFHPQQGTLTVNGGTIEGDTGIEMRAGTLTVNGGTITGTAAGFSEVSNGSGNTIHGVGIAVSQHGTNLPITVDIDKTGETAPAISGQYALYEKDLQDELAKDQIEINIKDGEFTSTSTAADAKAVSSENVKNFISGGTFSTDVVNEYVVEGAVDTKKDETGKWVIEPRSDSIAAIGKVGYPTLAEAIAAAEDGDTVTLLDNVALDSVLQINRPDVALTLDLGGKTLSRDGGGVLQVSSDLTIQNGTVEMTNSQGPGCTVWLLGSPKFVLDKTATITVSETQSATSFALGLWKTCDGAEATVNGRLTGENGLTVNGNITADNTVSLDSAVIDVAGHGVYLAGKATTTIENTEITAGNTGVEIRAGELTIKDGAKITAEGNFQAPVANNNGTTVSGAAVAISQHVTEQSITVTINGGELSATGTDGRVLYEIDTVDGGDKSQGVNVSVTDGTLIGQIESENKKLAISGGSYSQLVPEDCCATDYVPVTTKDDNGMYTVTKAAEDGKPTVTGLELDATSLNLQEGSSKTVKATVTTNNPDGDAVTPTWSSSDENVATVDADGKVTAVGAGTATITVKAGNLERTFTVTVSARPSSGGSHGSSSNYSVTVDAGRHGKVTVSPKSASKGDTVTITVKPDKGYELDELTVTDKNGDSVKLKKKSDTKYTFTMPASKVEVEAVFAKVEEQVNFIDVPDGYWAEDAIDWAFEKGYMNGTSADTFNPGGDVSRQQLWMILARLSGQRPADMAEARSWAVDNGVSDGTFPGRAVSRQQLVTILYRYAARMGYKTSGTADLTRFPDHASVAAYARDAMSWSVANDIVGGTAQGTLDPTGTATRAQFAVILSRFCENIVD